MVADEERARGSKTGSWNIISNFQLSAIFFRQDINLLLGNNLSLTQFKYEVRESPKIFVMHYLQLILH